MKQFNSRFGIISAGKIEAFDVGKSLTVDGEKIIPAENFWSRFSPQRVTVIPAPEPEEGEEKQPDQYVSELDFTIGSYAIGEGGHDRYLNAEEFAKLEPVKAEE